MGSGQTINVREAARRLGISLKAVYDALWAGRLRAEKIDGNWRISVQSVEERLRKRAEP